ncbi:flavodoxin [Methanovulcanius yangii]|uniref:flavodoxin n=1 Tax=Methanovulcanius yangii TaxID=1789227 RepID=UPI0029CA3A19|nr:flavodoxin [Methanovulcanius yangii]
MTDRSTLVAYFSHSGNTRVLAHQIHDIADGDVFEIDPVDQYPREYNAVVGQARLELDREFLPELKTKVADMDSYDVMFIGYPNWWGTIPRPVASFLSAYDLSGKTIVPFCTHEGSGLGRSEADIQGLCPRSTVPEGLAIRGSRVHDADELVRLWLRERGWHSNPVPPGTHGSENHSNVVEI